MTACSFALKSTINCLLSQLRREYLLFLLIVLFIVIGI